MKKKYPENRAGKYGATDFKNPVVFVQNHLLLIPFPAKDRFINLDAFDRTPFHIAFPDKLLRHSTD